ncbi:MAG: periplasmic heavy metal sensor [Nitrospirae bacterium]|nr:periplasmic heavy metal sensor [Nitrospirota bacterium]
MKKLFLLLSAAVLLLGLAVSSDAMSKKGGGMKKGLMEKQMCGEHMMMEKLASLGLDDRQKEEIKGIHLKTKKEMIRKKADIKVAGIELKEILGKETVDLQAAEAKVKQLESLKTEMKMTHIRTHEEVKSKLTPEQRKKFNEMKGMCCLEGEDCGGCEMGGGMRGMRGGMGKKEGCDKCYMKGGPDDDMSGEGHKHRHNK